MSQTSNNEPKVTPHACESPSGSRQVLDSPHRHEAYLEPRERAEGGTLPSIEPPFSSSSPSSSSDFSGPTPETGLLWLIRSLVQLGGPVAFVQALRNSMNLITMMFAGSYLTVEQFASMAVGLSLVNLTALNLGSGCSAALDTLATREHGRSPHSTEIATICLRSIICTFIIYIPIAVFYFFCTPVLALLIQKDLVADTALFLRWSMFIASPVLLNNNLLKFTQSQRVIKGGVLATLFGALALPFFLYGFRHQGLLGIVAALAIDRCLILVMLIWLISRHPQLRACWGGRSVREHMRAVVHDSEAMVKFIRVGLPALGATCADACGFEMMAVLSAHLDAVSAAVWGIMVTIYAQMFALFVGVASAAAIRIGNARGRSDGCLARRYAIATGVLAAPMSLCGAAVFWFFGGKLFWLIRPKKDDVAAMGIAISPTAGFTFAVDSLFYALQGPFRGAGHNGALLFLVVSGMWGVAVPLAFVFSVPLRAGVHGIVMALGIGMAMTVPIQILYILCGISWENISKQQTVLEAEPSVAVVDVVCTENAQPSASALARESGADAAVL
jgi:MATE family multidrug resistance protein